MLHRGNFRPQPVHPESGLNLHLPVPDAIRGANQERVTEAPNVVNSRVLLFCEMAGELATFN